MIFWRPLDLITFQCQWYFFNGICASSLCKSQSVGIYNAISRSNYTQLYDEAYTIWYTSLQQKRQTTKQDLERRTSKIPPNHKVVARPCHRLSWRQTAVSLSEQKQKTTRLWRDQKDARQCRNDRAKRNAAKLPPTNSSREKCPQEKTARDEVERKTL